MAQKPAELQRIAHAAADRRDQADRRGLLIDHADRHLVRDDAADRGGGGVAGDGDHVQSHRTYAGHRLQLFQRQRPLLHGMDHSLVLAHRDERAGKAAHIGRRHDAPLLDLIVEERQRGGGAGRARGLKADLLKDLRHRVADGRRRGERQVDDAKGDAEAAGGLLRHELPHARDLESGLFDRLAEHFKVLSAHLLQGGLHHARSGNADVDHRVRFGHAVERTRHKGVVVRRVAEHDELGAAQAAVFPGRLRGLADRLAHQADGVHVDAGPGGAHVDGAADDLRAGKRRGDRADEQLVRLCHSLGYKGRVTADKARAHFFRGPVEGLRDRHEILGAFARGGADQGDGRYGYALVHDRNAVIRLDLLRGPDEVPGLRCDPVVDLPVQAVKIRIHAVQKADAQRDRAHVQVRLLDHLICFGNFINIDHSGIPRTSDPVHHIEDIFVLAVDHDADRLSEHIQLGRKLARRFVAPRGIRDHHHMEVALQDRL